MLGADRGENPNRGRNAAAPSSPERSRQTEEDRDSHPAQPVNALGSPAREAGSAQGQAGAPGCWITRRCGGQSTAGCRSCWRNTRTRCRTRSGIGAWQGKHAYEAQRHSFPHPEPPATELRPWSQGGQPWGAAGAGSGDTACEDARRRGRRLRRSHRNTTDSTTGQSKGLGYQSHNTKRKIQSKSSEKSEKKKRHS